MMERREKHGDYHLVDLQDEGKWIGVEDREGGTIAKFPMVEDALEYIGYLNFKKTSCVVPSPRCQPFPDYLKGG